MNRASLRLFNPAKQLRALAGVRARDIDVIQTDSAILAP